MNPNKSRHIVNTMKAAVTMSLRHVEHLAARGDMVTREDLIATWDKIGTELGDAHASMMSMLKKK